MKILIFESWSNSPQFETSLEIAEKHAAKGDDVTFVTISGHLSFVEWHLGPNASIWSRWISKYLFMSKMKKTAKVLNPKINFNYSTLLTKEDVKSCHSDLEFNDVEELKNYEWKNMDIGLAAASSLISVTNDLSPDVQNQYKKGVQRILYNAKTAALSFEKWLNKTNPDLVYFRNGRVALYRPIMRICQQRNQKYLIHDRGCDKDHYVVSPDLRHNFDMINDEAIEAWDNETDVEKKTAIAHEFFKIRRAGAAKSGMNFIDKQKKNILPDSWDSNNVNLVYFNSSLSEYIAIYKGKFSDTIFDDQIKAIHFIADQIKDKPNHKLYIRLHPNLLNQDQKEKDLWLNINHPSVEVIKPESSVDTYSIMEQADLVFAFSSTTGIEAAYFGKPVISLNKSDYYKLGSVYFPKSKEELVKLINTPNLKPLPQLGALKFGFYKSIFGTPYQFFEAKNLREGTFKGVNLQKPPQPIEFISKLINQ